MQTWAIVSWVFVAILTGINIYFFLKLKQASEQMLKTAFPGAKDMNEAVAQMQRMMKGMGGMGGLGGLGGMPGAGAARGKGAGTEDQLAAARKMLERMQAQKSGPKGAK